MSDSLESLAVLVGRLVAFSGQAAKVRLLVEHPLLDGDGAGKEFVMCANPDRTSDDHADFAEMMISKLAIDHANRLFEHGSRLVEANWGHPRYIPLIDGRTRQHRDLEEKNE